MDFEYYPLKSSANVRCLYALSGFNAFQASDVYFCNVFVGKLKKKVTCITGSIKSKQSISSLPCLMCSEM